MKIEEYIELRRKELQKFKDFWLDNIDSDIMWPEDLNEAGWREQENFFNTISQRF